MSTSSSSAFFAVRKGNTTGVYVSWDKCKESIAGFDGAEFAGFEDEGDAFAWLNKCGKYAPKVPKAESSAPTAESSKSIKSGKPAKTGKPGKYAEKSAAKVTGGAKKTMPGKKFSPKVYAVARGHVAGVFNSYAQIADSISFYPKPVFKSFFSKEQASQWVDEEQAKGQPPTRAEVEEHSKAVKAGKGPFWAVAVGYATGVFDHVQTCISLTKGNPDAVYEEFDNYEEAVAFVAKHKQ